MSESIVGFSGSHNLYKTYTPYLILDQQLFDSVVVHSPIKDLLQRPTCHWNHDKVIGDRPTGGRSTSFRTALLFSGRFLGRRRRFPDKLLIGF